MEKQQLSHQKVTMNIHSRRERIVRAQLRLNAPWFKNYSCFLSLPQVACVSNFFEQPVEPVVSQEEDESHSSLQENPSNGNHYGSTDWFWSLGDRTVTEPPNSRHGHTEPPQRRLWTPAGCFCACLLPGLRRTADACRLLLWSTGPHYRKKSALRVTVLALYWVIKQPELPAKFFFPSSSFNKPRK